MQSEIAAASDSIATPVSGKKLRWVKTGSLKKPEHTARHGTLLPP